MIPFDIGDPANPNSPYSQQTPVTLPGSTARLLALNDTPYQILLQFSGSNGARLKVPSGWARIFPVAANAQQVMWTIDKSLVPSSAVISDLTLEAYVTGEDLPNQWPIMRQMGGQVKAVSATQVQNDGMPAPSTFVEATSQVPAGISPYGSNVTINNDGTFAFIGLSNGAAENFMQTVPVGPREQIVIGNQDVPVQLGASVGQTNGDVTIRGGAQLLAAQGVFKVDTLGNITGAKVTSGGVASLDNGALTTTGNGHFNTYDNVATAGEGVPPVRASLEPPVTVTALTLQNVLSFTPANNGLYMAMMRIRLNNGTSGQLIAARVGYTDPDTGAAPSFPFQFGNSAGVYQVAAGAVSFTNQVWDSQPLFFRAKGGSAITLQYQDPANTPNDQVSGAIIQIA